MFFSIVIPVYNKGPHIARALNSVFSQKFDDFEVIVVCDPSTDNSNTEVEKFQDPRIKVFYRNQPGPGGYAARNLGIEKAQGEWIAFLDADDEWLPCHLEKMHALSQKFPGAMMLGAGWESRSAKKSSIDKYSRQHPNAASHLVTLSEYLQKGLHGSRPIHTSVACVKRSSPLLSELFIIHPEVKRGGDLFAWLKMLCFHKQMAWSNHIGSLYYTDALNMVTKSAPSTGYLMSEDVFKSLALSLKTDEKLLLQKYFNRWLRNDWKSNIHRGCQNFNLAAKLYWRGDFLYALVLYITTVWPQNVRKLFGFSGRKY
ncbi:glycosyltransferase family 2 protein [Thiomicrospira pelophila]|uniref:glycosyltransferase family 2 protein n=1 Tax=Thiomicrospira pelophila TaxID=934 RepID=UPI00068F704E|nr:glycosyltransferase family A protein [Thiomicrospira pelophila]